MPISNTMSEPNLPNSNRDRVRDDRGFMIIEVLVSALILIMASLAVFSALDNADKAAGNQQARAEAANWAQSELERIRSLPVEDIAAMKGTRTSKRNGVTYTIDTTTKWVSDGDDEPKCTTRNGGVDFMRLTVKITWTGMGKGQDVTFTSLFTPTAGAGGDTGSLSVNLMNRDGAPVAGVPVTVDGPATFSGVTNKNGCVVFAFIPSSLEYTVRFQRLGYVNQRSDSVVTEYPVSVTARETTKLQYLYDSGGFTLARFRTRSNGPNSGFVDSSPPAIQMFHIDQGTPQGITVPLDGTQTSWNGAGRPWFPFTTPYTIYAGNCNRNLPPNSFPITNVNISPLATQNADWVQLPALDVEVRSGTSASNRGSLLAGASVVVDADCGTPWILGPTDGNGTLRDPGIPSSTNTKVCIFVPGSPAKRLILRNAIATTGEWNSIPIAYAGIGGSGDGNYERRSNGTAAKCFE